MILKINADGSLTGIVGSLKEEMPIDLDTLGTYTIKRQGVLSEVDGKHWASMHLASGPILGPFDSRSEAIAGEIEWLQANRF